MAPESPPPRDTVPIDATLLARARAGEASALQALCVHLAPRLRQAAAKRLGRLQEKVRISDVLQSTFFDIVRSSDQIPDRSEDGCVQWSLRVLDNNIHDLARYFTAQRRHRGREEPLERQDGRRFVDLAPSPATELVQAEEVSRLGLAMKELPDDYQRILHLFLRPDFSHEMAARVLGRSVGASRVLLARARAALLAKLEALGT